VDSKNKEEIVPIQEKGVRKETRSSEGVFHAQGGMRTLTWTSICFITYFNVCGGPWGSEQIVSSVGPLPGIIGLFLMFITFGVPLGLITAELSTAFPGNGGYSVWVSEALGPFWGLQESFWSWMGGVVDNAIYPLLTYQAIMAGIGVDANSPNFFLRWVIRIIISLAYSIPGLFLVKPIGSGLGVFMLFIVTPFFLLAVLGPSLNESHASNLLAIRTDADWSSGYSPLLNTLYWNFSGIDSASTSAGEVINPRRNFPRGLLACVALTTFTYLIPLLAAASVNNPDYKTWEDRAFYDIAEQQVGGWLRIWIGIAGVVGNAGMYVAEMFEDSWQLQGMAEVSLVPSLFRYRHPRFRTPINAILIQVVIICLLQAFSFNVIVCIDNFFAVISVLLELIAFVVLRVKRPDLPRPYKVPIHNTYLLVAALSPIFALGLLVAFAGLTESVATISINLSVLVFGIVCALVMVYYKYSKYVPRRSSTLGDEADFSADGIAGVDKTNYVDSNGTASILKGGSKGEIGHDGLLEGSSLLVNSLPQETKALGDQKPGDRIPAADL